MTVFWLAMFVQTATATTGGSDAIGLLSVGAFVAILNAGVTFGIVKGKTDSMEAFKTEMRAALAAINTELASIQRALGRLEGRPRQRDDSDE